MKLASLAVGCCAALALAATALDAQAGKGRGGGGGGGGRGHAASGGSGGHHHHHHGQSRVFIGGSFGYWPRAYYWPGYSYVPAVAAPVAYWYYCTAAGAYYPYVQDCPGGWELVLPTAPPYTGY